jgi:PAS domain S-box-containing protein
MKDKKKTKQGLIQELVSLRQRIAELEQLGLEHQLAEKTLHEVERLQRLAFERSSDVIFTLDCDLRVTSVSTSVERHLGYRTGELVGKLFNDINVLAPESLEAAFKDALQTLAGGTPTAEYVFVRKDGSRVIGEVSGSPLVEDGKIVGSIAVARDITDRKRAEEALRESEEKFRVLADSTPTAVMLYQDDRWVYANRAAETICGYSEKELLAISFWDIVHPDFKPLIQERGRKRQRGEETTNRYEFKIIMKDGTEKWVDLSGASTMLRGRPAGIISVLDITDHKRVESIMQARLHLLEFVNSHSMDEFLIATLDEIEALTGSQIGFYHFLESDQKTLTLQNWSTNTLKNMCTAEGKGSHYDIAQAGVWVDCVHERRPIIHNDYASLPHRKGMPEGHAPVVREVVVPIFRDNLIKTIIGVGNKSTNYDESDIGIVSQLGDLSWDITERKRAEEELSRVNRALQMLSDTNQALIHIADEAALLNEVCRISVEVGGYRMAWVGFAEQDEAKTVRPAAHAGFESGYIESANVTWADNERGRGPSGTAIRTGQPCMARNIPVDPAFAPWRQAATQRGYKASIALPLISEGQAFGALNIYSSKVDAFDAKEVEILKELADDLAFGITALRTRAKRDQAEEALRHSKKEKTILNEIDNIFLTIPDDAMYGEVLAVVLQVMNSRLGYFGYIGENGDLVIPSLTREIWRECQVPDKSIVFPSDSWGGTLWGRAIREKRAFSSDGPFRTPGGHIHVDHFLVTPIIYGQEAIGVISVANREGGYGENDKDLLERIAGYVSPILNARLQRDVQERKRELAVEALRGSEERFRNLVESAKDVILTISPDSIITSLNPAFEKIIGWSRAEWIGKPFASLVHPDDLPLAVERFQRNLQGEATPDFELRVLSKSGEYKVGEFGVTPQIQSGKVISILGVTRDVTERKRAEEEYVRLVTAIEQAAEGIFISDTNWIIKYVNPAFEHMTGYSRSDIIDQHTRILKSDKHDKAFYKKIRDTISQGNVWSGRAINKRKDGKLYEAEVTASPVRDKTGAVINHVAIHRDITREVKLENELRQMQKMQAIGTLAGGIAHDFNNILAAIIGYTEIAKSKLPEESPVRHNLEHVLKAGFRATDLVKQILTFSRQTDQERKPVSVVPIIKEVLKFMRSSLPATIEMQQDIVIPPEKDIVLADPTQLHQVLMNLCTNAAHAMHGKGGILKVTLSDIEVDAYLVAQHPDLKPGAYVRLTVSDTGHGMDAATMERIFEPYFTTKKLGEGTGLGLSVVQGIVKSHGGVITVYSEPGQVTSFHVYFPRIGEAITPETVADETLLTGSERILFVDDEKALVDMGKEMLNSLGYKVVTRTSSCEALDAFHAQPDAFDVVVTDMTMPEMTGIELAKIMLKIRPDIPIILCTGFSELINEKQVKEMGIRALLIKPFVTSKFAKTIRQMLDKNGLHP